MFIRVQGAVVRTKLNDILKSGCNKVNIKINQNETLGIQTVGPVTHDIIVDKVIEVKGIGEDVTFKIDETIALLNSKSDVVIALNGNIVSITQDSFNYSAEKEPDMRVETGVELIDMTGKYDASAVVNYITSLRALDDVSRSLAAPVSAINISNGIAYVCYTNTRYAKALNLPDMAIPGEIAKKVANSLLSSKSSLMENDADNSVVHFKLESDEYVTVATTRPNLKLIEAMEEDYAAHTHVTVLDFPKYVDSIDAICKAYRKASNDLVFEFQVCENNGLKLFVSTSRSQIVVGSPDNAILTIRLSIAQMSAIARLFGSYTNVEILRGDNKICLQQKNLGQRLVVSGMLY